MVTMNMTNAVPLSVELIGSAGVGRLAGSEKTTNTTNVGPSAGEQLVQLVDPKAPRISVEDHLKLTMLDLQSLEEQQRSRVLAGVHAESEQLSGALDALEQHLVPASDERRALRADPELRNAPDNGDAAGPAAPAGDSFSRLTELLTRAMLMLGKMSSERSAAGMQMAVTSAEHARKAGDKIVESARHNLGGAIAGAAVGLVTTTVGTGQVMKSHTRQIKNLQLNDRKATQLRDDARSIRKSIAQADVHELQPDQLRNVGGRRRSATLQSSERNLTRAEREVLEAKAVEMDQDALSLEQLSREVTLKQQRNGVRGQAIASMAQPAAGIAQSGAGVAAAAATGQVKVEDSSSAIAASMQQSLVQSAARTEESLKALLAKLEQLMAGRQSLVLGMLRA